MEEYFNRLRAFGLANDMPIYSLAWRAFERYAPGHHMIPDHPTMKVLWIAFEAGWHARSQSLAPVRADGTLTDYLED